MAIFAQFYSENGPPKRENILCTVLIFNASRIPFSNRKIPCFQWVGTKYLSKIVAADQPRGNCYFFRKIKTKSGVDKRVVSKRVVLADVPPERKLPRNEDRNEGTFACSPGTKTGTRVRSPKPPFYETSLLSPSDKGATGYSPKILRDFGWARPSSWLLLIS